MNRQIVMKLKEAYLKSYRKDLGDFDKNLFFVASGIFAFSVTFIKDIVNIRAAHLLVLLLVSWGLFAISIGLIILAFYLSAIENAVYVNKVDEILLDDELSENSGRGKQKSTDDPYPSGQVHIV